MKLLSIVIPCYNVEQYLAECLDSILAPEYNDVLEVLAINDGSKDGTLALAREYEAKFPDILRVIDKPNGGWGTVINMAIAEARGRYFKILDSDDWFDKAAFVEFMDVLSRSESDIIGTVYTEIYNNSTIEGTLYEEKLCNKSLTLDDYIKLVENTNLPMTNITVRRDILNKFHSNLPPRYYGDICFILYVFSHAESIYLTNINLYQYRKDLSLQSTSVDSYRRNYKNFIDVSKVLVEFYSKNTFSRTKQLVIKNNILGVISFAYKLLMSKEYCGMLDDSRETLLDFNKYLKQTSPDLYRACFKITNKHVPYVLIWRLFNINLFKLKR